MKIALCQLNTVPGNVAYNTRRTLEELEKAAQAQAQLVIFPELSLIGYPPKDLLEYDYFVHEAQQALPAVQGACSTLGVECVVGIVTRNIFGGKNALLNSAAFVSAKGEVQLTHKKLLPTYDVFDEQRYFRPAPPEVVPPVFTYSGAWGARAIASRSPLRLGMSICEDIWNDKEFWKDGRRYECDPVETLVEAGANVIVNISASPFVIGKPQRRMEMLRHAAKRWKMPFILVNQIGGCDQIVFDGGSCVVLPDGSVPCAAGWFEEKTVYWDTEQTQTVPEFEGALADASNDVTAIHDALTLGLRDYMSKTGFSQVIVGNSGGIDSATVLALAVSALGAPNVISVSMPGPYTSKSTRNDATRVAQRLGVRHMELPIGDVLEPFRTLLQSDASPVLDALFDGDRRLICRLADENVQARIRGNILMWLSNAQSSPRTLVLSTGNKSEIAAGYCTLYGDMAGGLAVISDVPKMTVYRLARLLNARMGNPIPESILKREPTAELAPNQKDSDSLPPYPILDEIIRLFVEEHKGVEEIIDTGVAAEDLVRRVVRMVENAEYKRAQAAPGLKVTSKAFGFGRRMPIARGRTA